MIHEFAHVLRPTRLRTLAVVLLGVILGAACDDNPTEPVATNEPIDTPAAVAEDSSVAVLGAGDPAFATISYTGLPFGPFGLWDSYATVAWGPSPFTGSGNFTDPAGIVTQISAARTKHQRLFLAMTGGPSTRYTTNGKFDMVKWKNRMNQFKTTAIKNAVAAGVTDGTIVGNSILDEPETKRWGGVLTKPMLDQMGSYVKGIFPTLKVGVNHGPTGYYLWRASERYKVLDYVANQYSWWITTGNVAAWRDKVLAQARLDGVTPAFSLNALDGGVQDRSGTYDCGGVGMGTYYPNCNMTPTQVRDWGRALGPYGCGLLMWKFNDKFMSKSANVTAVKDIATTMNSKARRSCSRT